MHNKFYSRSYILLFNNLLNFDFWFVCFCSGETGVARAKKTSWYNAVYPSYKSRTEDFKKIFTTLPSNERLIAGEIYYLNIFLVFSNLMWLDMTVFSTLFQRKKAEKLPKLFIGLWVFLLWSPLGSCLKVLKFCDVSEKPKSSICWSQKLVNPLFWMCTVLEIQRSRYINKANGHST